MKLADVRSDVNGETRTPSAAEIEFRPYHVGDRDAIVSLLSVGRPADYLKAKSTVFDWQFNENPTGGCIPPFVVGTHGGEVVAVTGFMPIAAKFQGDPVIACWNVDTYVSADFRGLGIGRAIARLASKQAPVMLAFGISDMNDPIFEKSGWLLDSCMSNFYFHANQRGVKGVMKNLLTRSVRTIRGLQGRHAAEYGIESAIPDEELDTAWNAVRGQYDSAVERNSAYLSWKYGSGPLLHYRWITARRGGELQALLVTRHDPVESVIADYSGPADDSELLAGLCDAAIADLVAIGTVRIRCETNHASVKAALSAVGFIRARKTGRFRVYSARQSASLSTRGWLVMTGDSDNDLLG